MDYFFHPDPSRRVLLAGTYNAHPIPTAAAIATLEVLLEDDGAVYRRIERLGQALEQGLRTSLDELDTVAKVVREGSAFVAYFMDHAPVDWHDLAAHHDFEFDAAVRRALIDHGVYFFPVATKQCSLTLAHTDEDVELTIRAYRRALRAALVGRQ